MGTEVKKANKLVSSAMIGKMMLDSFDDIRQGAKEGKKTVWAWGLPVYVLARAAGLQVLHAEGFIVGLAARKKEKPVQDATESMGFSTDACSYARSFLGLARIACGDYKPNVENPYAVTMPKPDIYCASGGGCGTARLWGEAMEKMCKIPGFHFEPRVIWEGSDLESAVADFVNQEKEFIALLERETGKPYDWNRLSELLIEVKSAISLRHEVMKACHHIPSPGSFFDWAASIGVAGHLIGLPGSTELLKDMKKEIDERIELGISAVPNERYRLYWEGVITWNKIGWLADEFASLDACVIGSTYTNLLWWPRPDKIDPEKPLESIAYNCVDIPVRHGMEYTVDYIAKACQEYSIDGMVVSETQTCRGFNSHTLGVMNGVTKKLNIPGVIIGGDPCDGRFFSEAQTDTRLRALLETIDARRKVMHKR
ncbi:MAG: 2-hydroxyacyl-CoA dehydratase family protein [Chloroflexi bacterium]|nr:2-hydroxyacyl-CoA dehydratase family protein [Chloroflexota bacterium]